MRTKPFFVQGKNVSVHTLLNRGQYLLVDRNVARLVVFQSIEQLVFHSFDPDGHQLFRTTCWMFVFLPSFWRLHVTKRQLHERPGRQTSDMHDRNECSALVLPAARPVSAADYDQSFRPLKVLIYIRYCDVFILPGNPQSMGYNSLVLACMHL